MLFSFVTPNSPTSRQEIPPVTFGFTNSKKNSFRGNYMRKLGILVFTHFKQSHYIEVVQGGASSRAIHYWLCIFSLFWPKKYFKNQFFLPMKIWKNALKNCSYLAPIFFSISNQPKSYFLSHKIGHCAT